MMILLHYNNLLMGGVVSKKFMLYAMAGTLNIYPKSLLLISMYYCCSTFIDS